jgi:hypothetical protein
VRAAYVEAAHGAVRRQLRGVAAGGGARLGVSERTATAGLTQRHRGTKRASLPFLCVSVSLCEIMGLMVPSGARGPRARRLREDAPRRR